MGKIDFDAPAVARDVSHVEVVNQAPTIIPTIPIARRGRPPLTEEQKAQKVKKVPERVPEAVCIRINMTKFNVVDNDLAIYERTRGAWKVGERAFSAKYAIAAVTGKYNGIVSNKIIAVYDIVEWQKMNPAGYSTRKPEDFAEYKDRYEFIGKPTDNPEMLALIGKIFKPNLKLNGSNPISFRPLERISETVRDIPEEPQKEN